MDRFYQKHPDSISNDVNDPLLSLSPIVYKTNTHPPKSLPSLSIPRARTHFCIGNILSFSQQSFLLLLLIQEQVDGIGFPCYNYLCKVFPIFSSFPFCLKFDTYSVMSLSQFFPCYSILFSVVYFPQTSLFSLSYCEILPDSKES